MTAADTEALALAASFRRNERSAVEIVQAALQRIATLDPAIGAVTRVLGDRALERARALDRRRHAGEALGPLAGVPFGVKDLFDVAGLPTNAGAGFRRDAPPATADAEAVRRLEAQGAILVATLNMDAFAYGFATDNADFGLTRNPHDPERLAGGSSGGSAAVVAAGMLPLTLGSDTNGSTRVPASLCGVWGLKPTHGALPMQGVFPFVNSFDDIGPFARSARDLEAAWRALAAGGDASTPQGELRVKTLGGWFARNLDPAMAEELDRLRTRLDAGELQLDGVDRARSAAFLMTAAEGGALHLPTLRTRALAYDPAVRDRLLAGAALPPGAYSEAQRFRERFRAEMLAAFRDADVLIAPATAGPAPRIDAPTVEVDGRPVSARANLGLYTQPISFIGLPVIAAPLTTPGLPMGLQLIGSPGAEPTLFAFAQRLEDEGVFAAKPTPGAGDGA